MVGNSFVGCFNVGAPIVEIKNVLELDLGTIYGDVEPYTAEGFSKFQAWLDANNALYVSYDSRWKHSAAIGDALEKAKAFGKSLIVFEYMS